MIPATAIVEEGEYEQIDAQSGSIEDDLELLLGDGGSGSEVEQVLHVIGDVIDCLLRLSVTMRNPAPHDQFKSRAGEGVLDSYEKWDIQHVQEKFSNLDSTVAQRLGKALTRRRQYFRYRLQHHNRLSEGIGVDEDAARTETDGKSTIASSLPDHLKDPAGATESERNDWLDMEDKKSDISQTSYTPSNANPDQLRVPQLPKDIKGPFLCQFCHMLVSIDSRHAWKYISSTSISSDYHFNSFLESMSSEISVPTSVFQLHVLHQTTSTLDAEIGRNTCGRSTFEVGIALSDVQVYSTALKIFEITSVEFIHTNSRRKS
jgi:hypothetical protein